MPFFRVEVCRVEHKRAVVEVTARNAEEAEAVALEVVGDDEYEVVSAEESARVLPAEGET
jgi:hypothetical protein